MGIKRHKPEEIVTKLRQVEVMCGQGMPRIDAIRKVQIVRRQNIPESVSVFTTGALVRFLFEFRRQQLGAATGVF